MNLHRFVLAAAAAAFAGCATLPPAEKPLAQRDPHSAGIERTSLPDGAWPDAAWWKRYGDAQLDALIERALIDAPSMATAQARLHLAERSVEAADAARGAKIDFDASVTREKLSRYGLIPPPYGGRTLSDAEAKFGFSYDFDWWGKNRATLAAAVSEERAAQVDRAAAALVLTSAVAQQYFAWQALDARIALARRTLDEHQRLIRILQARVERGLESSASVDAEKSRRDTMRQNLAALTTNQLLAREQLRALMGAAPGELPELKPATLPTQEFGIPPQLGIDLISRRPDVEASRLRIEAQTHRIESAQAEFYPDISVSAFAGLSSVLLSKFFNVHSGTLGVAPAVHLPIFDAGRLRANLGVTRANLDVAIATYNQSVVDAASDVATQATTLAGIADQRRAAADALQADEAVKANADLRVRQGVADARDTIAAEITSLAQRDALLQIDAARLQTQVALVKALGGGWRAETGAAVTSNSNSNEPARITETASHGQ
ncbi:MAG TPA: efflux transporter outer membrane subunit [Rudaea sp.]